MKSDFNKYLWYGSLPHMVHFDNESVVYDQIQQTLDKIIHSDIPMVKFHPDTISIIP
jgi:predicted AAA+ superfamily ATPase